MLPLLQTLLLQPLLPQPEAFSPAKTGSPAADRPTWRERLYHSMQPHDFLLFNMQLLEGV